MDKAEKILEELKSLMSEDHSEEIEKAKESIKKDLERNPKAVIYVSPSGTLFSGRLNHLLALIAMIFDTLSDDEDITTELLTTAFFSGMTKGSGDKKAKETMNDILETLKKLI